jgi:thiol-disulfide isomerase/thioredoxin
MIVRPGSSTVRRSRLAAAALAVAVASAAAANARAQDAPLTPSKGEVVPAFETMRVDGKPEKVDFPKGSRTMLLFFTSACPHCHKMIPEWNRVYEKGPKNLRILGIILDQEPPGFWSTMPVSFPVLRSPGREFLRALNVNRVPLTLRVAEGGKVEDVGLGEVCSGGAAGTPGASCIDAIRLGQLFAPGPAR